MDNTGNELPGFFFVHNIRIADRDAMQDALAKIEKAARMLEQCRTASEAFEVAAVASSAASYARKIGLTLDAVNYAAELHLRALRQAGGYLAAMEKAKGTLRRGSIMEPRKETRLSDIGISKTQSHRCQTIAAIPSPLFDDWVRATHESKKYLTVTAAYKLGRQQMAAEPEEGPLDVLPIDSEQVATLDDLAGRKFGTIYADPPWQYGNQSTRASTDNHYSTMTVDELCEMPVAEHVADDAHLHLWTTNSFLPDAFRVIASWGFEYRSCYVWVKPQMGIGNYWRVSHELLLLGVRGNAKRFNQRHHKSWGEFPRTKHSAKPEEVRRIIESVSPGPFLELFGRRLTPGWTTLGNQIERTLFDQAS